MSIRGCRIQKLWKRSRSTKHESKTAAIKPQRMRLRGDTQNVEEDAVVARCKLCEAFHEYYGDHDLKVLSRDRIRQDCQLEQGRSVD